METVKAEILHGNVEHSDMSYEVKRGEKRRRTVSSKGAVVQLDKKEFEGLERMKAVRKATGELKDAPAPSENEPPVGATSAPVAETSDAQASSKKAR